MKRERMRAAMAGVLVLIAGGCGGPKEKRDQPFFTSGSREADQRASQRMTKAEQTEGQGGTGEEDSKLSLFERLGGEQGIRAIIDDFTPRLLADPRVNFERRGVKSGGMLGIGGRSEAWKPTPDAVGRFKQHMAQFLALATGGPARYDGQDMKSAHAGMRITNPEFDAAVGDLKATLDKLKVPDREQKEVLAIVESTRPQIVEVR